MLLKLPATHSLLVNRFCLKPSNCRNSLNRSVVLVQLFCQCFPSTDEKSLFSKS
uniref:Uncharacterized protein n=1 Tax=Medicago truncatula TaxID=3880 RepID=B7FG05_MEDTR|nr:unknown [Medicago truncatula]